MTSSSIRFYTETIKSELEKTRNMQKSETCNNEYPEMGKNNMDWINCDDVGLDGTGKYTVFFHCYSCWNQCMSYLVSEASEIDFQGTLLHWNAISSKWLGHFKLLLVVLLTMYIDTMFLKINTLSLTQRMLLQVCVCVCSHFISPGLLTKWG